MWAASQFIGCAAARVNKRYAMMCNYSPAGNVLGEPVFVSGTPCSNCEVDRASCSRVFLGLCGLGTDLKEFYLNFLYRECWFIYTRFFLDDKTMETTEASYSYVAYVMLAAGLVWFVGTLWLLHKLAANI